MPEFIYNQILFYASLVLVLFLPGYFLLLAVFRKSKIISPLERFIISFGLSIVGVDFIFFLFDKFKIPITRLSSVLGIGAFILICLVIYRIRKSQPAQEENSEKLFSFSKNQVILIFLLIFLTFFIKTLYLSETISPSSTDLGHHMYWSKWLVENHQLPDYDGMPDFIIGEHIIFGAMSLIGGLDFFSAFPPVVLNLANILGIMAVFILVLRIFKNKNTAILSLFFLGVLYAVSAPQTKFVSGGVIGNILGNFLVPLAFYFYFRSLEFFNDNSHPELSAKGGFAFGGVSGSNKKEIPDQVRNDSKKFLALAIFTTFGLFYTHHLTSFIFLFIFAFLALAFIIGNFFLLGLDNFKKIFSNLKELIISPQVLATLALGLVFFFFIFTPNYVETSAVGTAVGTPSKSTREGLTIADIASSIGEARLGIGLFGFLALVFLLRKKMDFGYLLVASWTIILFAMSAAPQLLFINLPSSRIGNYLSYPLSILSALAVSFIFSSAGEKETRGFFGKNNFLVKAGFLALIGFAMINGISDSASAIRRQDDYEKLSQTFHSAKYLSQKVSANDKILKDHNYITGDSWIKLFFMKGYKYPESRGYFKRYTDTTKPREMCTLYMISNPKGKEAEKCFAETETNFIMVNPVFDEIQFKKLDNFDKIYANPEVAVFYRK